MTYLKKVEKTLGTLIEVEPLNETKLEEVGLNCNHNTPFSSKEVPSFDGPEPQPLLNSQPLDVSLGDVIGLEPPIKPHSPDSFRMKVVDYLTTQTPPSPHVVNSHPKGVYSYYNPGIDDPKRHYGFKPGLLGKSVSLGVDILNWEMFDDDWGLESKEFSPLREELSLFDRPKEVMDIAQKDKNEAKQTKPSTGMKRVREIKAEGEFILKLLKRLTLLGATLAIPHNIIGCEMWHAIQRLRFNGLMLVMIERLRLKIGERLKALDPSPLPYIKRHSHTEMDM
ncbi:hypothetical protein Tco_1121173 [Tanacetum coccineum]|uniref:Uncharacterized protein n=1 Tax=Tanacetum coccineum TaxID=301880 RepID=A0ABQ5IZV8_9ASTR